MSLLQKDITIQHILKTSLVFLVFIVREGKISQIYHQKIIFLVFLWLS